MHSPALGIAWELWRPHRWWLIGTAVYLLVLALIYQVVGVQALARTLGNAVVAEALAQKALRVEDLVNAIGMLSAFPVVVALIGMLMAFSYGVRTNLRMKDSSFPARMFVLPVRTRALVGWPMLYGTVAVALTWMALAEGVLRPCAIEALSWLVAVVAAAMLALSQAISWAPFGAGWLKGISAVVGLSAIVAVPAVGLSLKVPQTILVLIVAAFLPLAYGIAVIGVTRARCGDLPEWYWLSQRIKEIGHWLPRSRQPFAAAAQAQVWFEWQRHGLSLPFLVGCTLPVVLLPLLFGRNDALPAIGVLLFVALLPPFLAGFAGTTVSETNPWVKDYYGVPPFTAIRPLTCGALVAAKLKMAALSTLAAWALVLAVVPLAILITGHGGEVAEWWKNGLRQYPSLKFAALVAVGILGLVLLTWKQLVENLIVGLTGRAWVINACVFVGLGLFSTLILFGGWLYFHPAYYGTFFAVLPWLMGGLVLLKLVAAGWTCRAASRRRLVTTRTLVRLLSLWLVIAFGLVVSLWCLIPDNYLSVQGIVLGVVLSLPLARLAAAPLALAWNRHR
jgi:hypothetical protein